MPNKAQKNVPNFNWIEDDEPRKYCEKNFVNNETLEMLKEKCNQALTT